MNNNDTNIITRMLQHAERIIRYSEGLTFASFTQNIEKQDSILFNIEQLGELAGCVSKEAQAKYNNIPWRILKDMRNRVIHGYDGISCDIVWDTIVDDIPKLISDLKSIIEE